MLIHITKEELDMLKVFVDELPSIDVRYKQEAFIVFRSEIKKIEFAEDAEVTPITKKSKLGKVVDALKS